LAKYFKNLADSETYSLKNAALEPKNQVWVSLNWRCARWKNCSSARR